MSSFGEFFPIGSRIVAVMDASIPAPEICRRARLARDPRFDGRFYVGVLTTGIYCRPVCPARPPAEDNVRYFATAATAQDAGYRPCLRCRPEAARRLPEWTLGSATVIRALRLIDAGYLDGRTVSDLAAELAVSQRHLDRLFREQLGTTPKSLGRVRRVQLAKRLIDQSRLPLAELAMRAGYGSVRRFNDEIRSTFGRPPRALRRGGAASAQESPESISLHLPVREPYDAQWVFSFLAARSLPGLEEVDGLEYRRRLSGTEGCWLKVRWQDAGLCLEVPRSFGGNLAGLLQRVRRIFDLDADPEAITAALGAEPRLEDVVREHPGLRVPGAWNGFETTVRAILGQQVSVARATAMAGALCREFGGGDFPGPDALAEADVAAIGMPGQRGAAIRALARGVAAGDLVLDDGADFEELEERLLAIPGLGPWTVGYVSMRVARNPDAFPDKDWVVLKALDASPSAARQTADGWRPWRAYGVVYLWKLAERLRASGEWRGRGARRPLAADG